MNSGGMINATKMCKGFGKLLADYKRSDATRAYLKALSGYMALPIDDLWRYEMAVAST